MLEKGDRIEESFLYGGNIGLYMGSDSDVALHMDRRALLTEREREILRGDASDVQNLAAYQSKIRTRVKRRLDRLEADVELLAEVEPEIAQELHRRIYNGHDGRLSTLEKEIQRLHDRLDEAGLDAPEPDETENHDDPLACPDCGEPFDSFEELRVHMDNNPDPDHGQD